MFRGAVRRFVSWAFNCFVFIMLNWMVSIVSMFTIVTLVSIGDHAVWPNPNPNPNPIAR